MDRFQGEGDSTGSKEEETEQIPKRERQNMFQGGSDRTCSKEGETV